MKTGRKMNFVFAAIIALLVLIVFLLNAAALILSNRYPLSVDLSENTAYEIGEETKTLLDGLESRISIDVLASEDSFSGENYMLQLSYILKCYPRYSDLVSLRFIDYASDPSYAAAHSDLSLKDGDTIVSCGDKIKQIPLSAMFNYSYTATGSLTIESSRAEEALSSAIINVTGGESKRAAVLSGSGQKNMENFVALLVNNNYELETAVPATDDLSQYDLLLLLAPQTDLSEDDVRAIDSYLYNGGQYGKNIFYAASVSQAELPNLETLLAEWGVKVDSGAVFETKAERTYQYQPYYPIADYSSEKYRDMLIDPSTPILMPMCRPLEVLFQSRDGQFTETLLSFGETAGVKPAEAGKDFNPDDAEKWGPIPAMVLASRKVIENGEVAKQSNIIVSGSVSMLETLAMQNSSLANGQYLVNLINDLSDNEASIVIAAKSLAGKTLGITSAQVTRLGVLLGGILPLAILSAGFCVWLYRRHK